MQDKCPNCGEPLVTKTIKKVLATGSIDYPISQTCPKCHWSKDLTGASDIVSKPITEALPEAKKEEKLPLKAAPSTPPKPQPRSESSSNFNKIITVALAILVLGGLAWAFFLYPGTPTKQIESPMPTATATVTPTTVQPTSTPVVAEITPTGKSIPVFLDSQRGFIRNKEITIKPGDEIVWRNTGSDTLTLVSSDDLFDAQLLANDKEFRYTFKKTGTYNFYLKGYPNLNGTIVAEP
jgi:plastocyanin